MAEGYQGQERGDIHASTARPTNKGPLAGEKQAMNNDHDFYEGFEGEPEIRFVSVRPGGDMAASVRMWGGYFDAIMSTLKPGDDGWAGIALPYHLDEGWYEEGSWTVPDIDALISQWSQMDLGSLGHPEREVHSAVAQLLTDAKHQGAEVRILYE